MSNDCELSHIFDGRNMIYHGYFPQREKNMTLALCMIVKNEEEVLARCLESVKGIFDQIVIVDTGSNDKTAEIAAKYADIFSPFVWKEDFSAARNYSFSLASADYLMWLDADDVLLPDDAAALLQWKNGDDPPADLYFLPYRADCDENGNSSLVYLRERIVRRGMFVWEGAVHEAISPHGNTRTLNIAVTHKKPPSRPSGERNLRILTGQVARGAPLDARGAFYFARELFDHGLYESAAAAFRAFLERDGRFPDKISACRGLAACYRFQGKSDHAVTALTESFRFGPPRAEICCDLGSIFLERGETEKAIGWYSLALALPPDVSDGGFSYPDCNGFLPCIWLCVCFDRLGDKKKAEYYNELAGSYRPHDPTYLHNKQYFQTIFHEGES